MGGGSGGDNSYEGSGNERGPGPGMGMPEGSQR